MMIDEQVIEAQQREQTLVDVQNIIRWLAAHPEIPLPIEFTRGLNIYAWDSREEARIMARAMGTFEKNGNEQFLKLIKNFGSTSVVAVFSRSQVCERVVVGTVDVPETVIPERIEPAHTKEIVEYRCPSLLDNEEQP
jgi:hypothetical protein